jgi:glycolate oxidase iron-sulfur subunit
MKEMLETQQADQVTRTHLDRCLTCRACETTCPSGVRYGELLEIGRDFLEAELPRPALQRWIRRWLLSVVPRPARFGRWLRLGRSLRWTLPRRLAGAVPPAPAAPQRQPREAPPNGARRVLILNGCVQRAATPQVNAALAALLADRGIEVREAPRERCCGSLALHLGASAEARATMAANVDALTGDLDGVDAVISAASGCGVTLKDYGRLLADDPERRDAAAGVAARTVDAAEFLHGLEVSWQRRGPHRRVAWHSPCTLQHGQRITGLVESLLRGAGYELVEVADAHLCCGSAGTYSILQPELAAELKARKLDALQQHAPDVVATANVGCQLHLASGSRIPVVHWLELLR